MQLNEFKKKFHLSLEGIYPKTEIDSFFFLLLEETIGLKRIDLAIQPNISISQTQASVLNSALKRLIQQEPIQYIIGTTEFYGLTFAVNRHTLIPRPETEELVEWIFKDIESLPAAGRSKARSLHILDIGTGSGCIAISLAKQFPYATVTAMDISADALNIAEQNARLNEVLVNFLEEDILNLKAFDQQYDIIVSNPPYVRELEKKEMQSNVLENEPHKALFVPDNNPLVFYKKIAELANNHLTKNGLLYLEINQYLGAETCTMLREKGFNQCLLRQDLFRKNRMIRASLI